MNSVSKTSVDPTCNIQAPCFQILTPEEVKLVQTSRTQLTFRKGDNLTKQGAFASCIMFVADGLAKQYIEDNGSKNFNLRIIKPGEFIGLSAVFTQKTYNYSSVALTGCQVFLIEKEAVTTLIKQNGLFGFSLMKRYLEQNAKLFDTLQTVIYKQMNGRMAKTLMYIDNFKAENPDIFQLLTRKDMADFAGISTESAVKLLKGFEKDGLIGLQEKDITIIDYYELATIAKNG